MEHSLYQVDAFTDTLFCGNPACVVPLKDWLEDAVLLKIAKENAVSETAFFVQDNEEFYLRWFTPDLEMDLCGHATLATAHVLKTHLHFTKGVINFKTISGKVQVVLENDYYVLNFPSRAPLAASLPPLLEQAINIAPKSVFRARDYILVYENESAIKNIEIERKFLIEELPLNFEETIHIRQYYLSNELYGALSQSRIYVGMYTRFLNDQKNEYQTALALSKTEIGKD